MVNNTLHHRYNYDNTSSSQQVIKASSHEHRDNVS